MSYQELGSNLNLGTLKPLCHSASEFGSWTWSTRCQTGPAAGCSQVFTSSHFWRPTHMAVLQPPSSHQRWALT